MRARPLGKKDDGKNHEGESDDGKNDEHHGTDGSVWWKEINRYPDYKSSIRIFDQPFAFLTRIRFAPCCSVS